MQNYFILCKVERLYSKIACGKPSGTHMVDRNSEVRGFVDDVDAPALQFMNRAW